MSKKDYPITNAIRSLRKHKINFIPHLYDYQEKGGTSQTAFELNVDEHSVIKTIVVDNDSSELSFVLMHGDKEISLKELARQTNSKKVFPADKEKANKSTGYQFGGTTPFGSKNKLTLLVEESIFNLDKIYINGGKRGFIIEIEPSDLKKAFNLINVSVAI